MGAWLLELLSPERVQEIGVVVTSVLTIWMGRQAVRVKQLQSRVTELEITAERDRSRFRDAVLYIRELLRHIDVLHLHLLRQQSGEQPPAAPQIPDSLQREI